MSLKAGAVHCLPIFIALIATVFGNYYDQYPTYNSQGQNQNQQQQSQSPYYYRGRLVARPNVYAPETHVNRRSQQGSSSSSWINNLNSQQDQQTVMVQNKPRRTHYGQTGTTLTKFFDSEAAAGSSASVASSGRWNSRWNNRAGGTQKDKHNRVQMGVSNSMCDDAKTNLTVDWDMSPVNHTCYHPETRFPRDPTLPPVYYCDRLPPRYVPGHVCMDQTISYTDDIPTHGDHRPLWPMFGEYIYVPRERWLHNIEHGAIVMLYHPCAHPAEVNKLKQLVKGCVGKHIITPSTLLSPERPLALVAWSCRLLMSSVDEQAVIKFIQKKALKGPEGTYTKEGQYTFGLLQLASMTGNGAKYGYSRVECV